MENNLWTRRTQNGRLSLSTSNNGADESHQNGPTSSRNASFSKRFSDATAQTKSNPLNSITTPGGSLVSPTATSASNAFGLGSGAFASFGSAKTPKTPGNPFELAMGSVGSAGASKPSTTAAGSEKAAGKSAAKPSSMAPIAETTMSVPSKPPSKIDLTVAHPLREKWVFWSRPAAAKTADYEKSMRAMLACATAEEFWAAYRHLKHPSELPLGWDYHFFKAGIRPVWEDPINRPGGKWVLRIRKGVADHYWDELVMALVGDQFGEAAGDVCGAVVSVRNGEDVISLWTRTKDADALKIREALKRVFNAPPNTKFEFKNHDSSIQQRTAIEESRRDKVSSHHSDRRTSIGLGSKTLRDA